MVATQVDPSRTLFNPLTYIVIPDILLACVVATNSRRSIRVLFFVWLSYHIAEGLLCTTGERMKDYSTGCTLSGQWFAALWLLFLTSPVQDAHYITEGKGTWTSTPMKDLSYWRKIFWSMCLAHSPRGIGWNYQVPSIPPQPGPSRWRFVLSRLWRAAGCFFLVDVAQSYIHANPLFSRPASSAVSVTSQGYLWQCFNIISWGITPYGMMSMSYYLLSAMSVTVRFAEPAVWRDPYGKWKDAYTIRRFWGRTWHQMLRRYVSSVGKWLATFLGFQKGTVGSRYTQLYVGFCVSGLMHTIGGDAMVGLQYLGSSFPFFIAQAVVITFEDLIISLACKRGIAQSGWGKVVARMLGYCWVFAWFSLSMVLYVDWATAAGLGRDELLPASPIRAAMRVLGKVKTR